MPRTPLSYEDKEIRKIIADNLKKLTHGYTRAQLSDMTNIPTSTLSGYFTEKSTISMENAEKIAEQFNVDKADIDPRYTRSYPLQELKREKLEELMRNKESNDNSYNIFDAVNKEIPAGYEVARTSTEDGRIITALYHESHEYNFFDTSVAAGLPTSVEAFEEEHIERIAVPDSAMGKYAGTSNVFFTHINGDSMNNVIPDGSLIAVKKIDDCSELSDGDIVVFSTDNEFSVKRYINDKDNERIIFRPDSNNISFTDLTVNYNDTKELRIYGKVVVYIVQL